MNQMLYLIDMYGHDSVIYTKGLVIYMDSLLFTAGRERLLVDVNVFGHCHMADSLGVVHIWACCWNGILLE